METVDILLIHGAVVTMDSAWRAARFPPLREGNLTEGGISKTHRKHTYYRPSAAIGED